MESSDVLEVEGPIAALLRREKVQADDYEGLIAAGRKLARSEETVEDARRLFRRAAELGTGNGEAWYRLGILAMRVADWSEGANCGLMANMYGFRRCDALVLRGYCLEQLGNGKAAVHMYLSGICEDGVSSRMLVMANRGLARLSESEEIEMPRPDDYHKPLRAARIRFDSPDQSSAEFDVQLFALRDSRAKFALLIHSDSSATGKRPIESIELAAAAAARELNVDPRDVEFHVLVESDDNHPNFHRVRFDAGFEVPALEEVSYAKFERRTGYMIDWRLAACAWISNRP